MGIGKLFRKNKKIDFKNLNSITGLIELTQSKNGNERRLAASSLGKLSKFTPNIFEAVPCLIRLLDDEKPQVRQYSIIALGKIGDSRAIPNIEKLLNDGKYYVIDAAKFALLKMSKSNIEREEINFNEESLGQIEISESQKIEIFTVEELTKYIKNLLEFDEKLNNLLVRGEVSNLTNHASGHTYFSLKDEEGQIKCVLFKGNKKNINFDIEHGMKIIVGGSVEVYKPRGEYSIIVDDVQPDGLGSLNLAFNQLKEKLQKEGLFLDEHKKLLPIFPKTIGVITSSTGAALQDILNIIKKRYPLVEVLIVPTLVQGKMAASSIVESIKLMNGFSYVDVIILGRGGGSLEDLWCFNEEIVAREIFESKIPIISAIGHETDFTISDFVADYRAPTPSAAAEKVVPDIQELHRTLSNLYVRNVQVIKYLVESYRSDLNQISSRPLFKHPLDGIHVQHKELGHISYELYTNISNNINSKRKELEIMSSKLSALNPKSILKRGYSIIMKDNKIVKESSDVRVNDNIDIVLYEGELNAQIKKIQKSQNA